MPWSTPARQYFPAVIEDDDVSFPFGENAAQPSPVPFRVQKKVGAGTTVEIGGFSKIPNRFFGGGMARELKPSAALIYLCLCEIANRNSSLSFKVSDRAISSETTFASGTICDARKRLIEKGLIACTRAEGQRHSYTLADPKLEWVPLLDRLRVKLKPRGRSNTSLVKEGR